MNIFSSYKYLIATLAAICFLVAGCSKNSDIDPLLNGDATLSLNLSIPAFGVELKSVSGNPTEPETWSAWERAVDGRYLYRVTAFLLSGNRLVAKEDLSLSGEPEEAQLTFNGNFTHGTYRLMVVANYSAHSANDGENGNRTYGGVEQFSETIQEIINTDGTIENFTTLYENSFLKYKIISADGVCERVPQPLTLVKDIELHPGENMIEGELLRTYSRIRIVADNHSDEELLINSISFNDLFTQTQAYIFDNVGYISSRRAMNVAHDNAIVPFKSTPQNPMKIAGKQREVLFDAYILESRKAANEEQYSYTLNLGYGGTENFTLESTSAITSPSNVQPGYYLIYNPNSKRYLVPNSSNSSVEAGNGISSLKSGMALPKEYVWTFERNGSSGNNYYIGTYNALIEGQTSYYMSTIDRNSLKLGANKSVYYTLGSYNGNLTLRASTGDRMYIYVNNSKVTGRSSNYNNQNFLQLYKVSVPGVTTEVNIPLETIDDATGQPVIAEDIKRNDFVNAIVTVSYNKNMGHFKFEVSNWNSGGGDVEFN